MKSQNSKKRVSKFSDFCSEAKSILDLKIKKRVNALGGYGDSGEVIYLAHPHGCPSVLVDKQGSATATYMSNASIDFKVSREGEMDVGILQPSFDSVEKREIAPMSGNIWMDLSTPSKKRLTSLLNPSMGLGLEPSSIKMVKKASDRSMWYCSSYKVAPGTKIRSAVKLQLVTSPAGPALLRSLYLENEGDKNVSGKVWLYYGLSGTQYFAYNKSIWYDTGLPLDLSNHIATASIPYSKLLQIKRLNLETNSNFKTIEGTCDYQSFIGDTSALSFIPQALREGQLLSAGAGKRLNRFNSPVISASKLSFDLKAGEEAALGQSLHYITDEKLIAGFRKLAGTEVPSDKEISKAFALASKKLIKKISSASELYQLGHTLNKNSQQTPFFKFDAPKEAVTSEYANSVWTTVEELYENCRAHGAKLAEGIELGTRDRGQDMWPKMKEDPERIRRDLVHSLGFMIQTGTIKKSKGRMSLREKLHGMFPRQFPSRWENRSQEVKNDNRPYTDSPLWLIDSLIMYCKETGDMSILAEKVGTVKLTSPDEPEKSGLLGFSKKLLIIDVVKEVFECFERHSEDSPYKMAQILYGDWCDPVDMFGTSQVGDDQTRGHGRGVNTRLSAHLFQTMVGMIDITQALGKQKSSALAKKAKAMQKPVEKFANRLRKNVVKWAWEKGPLGGFIDSIHEYKKTGAKPSYSSGETGYTLGSTKKSREFDGRSRRVLTSMAWGLRMLSLKRDYLDEVPETDKKINELYECADKMLFEPRLGFKLYSIPIPNSANSRDLVGRMGIIPSGCAENGEYHHAQVKFHYFKLLQQSSSDKIWEQFKPMLSVSRDESLCGPFETPTTSYNADPESPHFGAGMYFGLSGSVDWLIEFFQKIAGLDLNLHDDSLPDLLVTPRLPKSFGGQLKFDRVVHFKKGKVSRQIPIHIDIDLGKKSKASEFYINGKKAQNAQVLDLSKFKELRIEVR